MKKLSGKYITVPLARRIIGMPGHASSKFNGCIRMQLRGNSPGKGGQGKVWENFKSAASTCKGTKNKK